MSVYNFIKALKEYTAECGRYEACLQLQTNALTERNTDKVDELAPQLEKLQRQVDVLDKKIIQTAKELALTLKTKATVSAITQKLNITDAANVKNAVRAAEDISEKTQMLLERNRTLIEGELVFVRGTIALVAQTSQENDPYSTKSSHAIWLDEAV